MNERVTETIHLDKPEECFDVTNPNHFLTVAEREKLESEYADWYAIHGDDDPAYDRTSNEVIWKWSWLHYNKPNEVAQAEWVAKNSEAA